jgi:hypothetical protein
MELLGGELRLAPGRISSCQVWHCSMQDGMRPQANPRLRQAKPDPQRPDVCYPDQCRPRPVNAVGLSVTHKRHFKGTLSDPASTMSRTPGGRHAKRLEFRWLRGPAGALDEGERRGDARHWRRLVQRPEGDDGAHVGGSPPVFLPKLHSQHVVTLRTLGSNVSRLNLRPGRNLAKIRRLVC